MWGNAKMTFNWLVAGSGCHQITCTCGRGVSSHHSDGHLESVIFVDAVFAIKLSMLTLWCILLGCWDFNLLPTNGLSLKKLKVELLAGVPKATEKYQGLAHYRHHYPTMRESGQDLN